MCEFGGDGAVAIGVIPAFELIVLATFIDGGIDLLRGDATAFDGIMAAFDSWHVDEARGASDQDAAGEGEIGDGLVSAFGDSARAIGDTVGAVEEIANEGMGFEALELAIGREVGVTIIEMDDEAEGEFIVMVMIGKAAAAGFSIEGPTEAMEDCSGVVTIGLELP